ncbi:hypothetical protein Tco_0915115 [Tanacetum coccineum]
MDIKSSPYNNIDELLDIPRYDAVTYLKYLDSLRASESFRSEILEEIEAERQKQATSADECVMRGEWEKYLLSKVQLHALPKRNKNKTQNQKHKGFGVLDGEVPTTPSKGVEGSTSIITQEHDALLAAATKISKQAQKGIEIIDDPQNCVTTKGRGFVNI